MEVKKSFRVSCSRDEAVSRLADEKLITDLIPGDTEIVERKNDRCTTRTEYTALGQEGVATFHFTYLLDGNLRFEKECDGRVWRELVGDLEIDDGPKGKGARVTLAMRGRTKPLVPEFTIKAPMQEQMKQMMKALKEYLSE